MNKLILISLLGLTNCASFMQGFEEGQREGNAFLTGFVVQAARHPDWNGANDNARTEEIKLAPRTQCRYNLNGVYICE